MKHLVVLQISHIAAIHMTELVSWGEKSGKYWNELKYELSLLSVLIY